MPVIPAGGELEEGAPGQWWRTPLIPALGRQRLADLCEFKASLIYKMNSRTARTVTQRNPVLKINQANKQKKPHKLMQPKK